MKLILFIAIQILSVILLYFNARKFPSSIYLGVFFMLISLCCFSQLPIFYPETTPCNQIIFLSSGFAACILGPVLYLYFRCILTDNSHLTINNIWHLIPTMLFLISILFFVFNSASTIFLGWPILIMVYAIWLSIQLISSVKCERDIQIFPSQKIMIPWLINLLGILFLVAIILLTGILQFSFINDVGLIYIFNILQYILLLWLVGSLALVFIFPSLLYGLPQLPGVKDNSKISIFLTYDGITTKPNSVSGYILFIQQKTDSFMKDMQPWLQSRCNLAYFSKITCIPSHHLACYFKYIKKQSFTNFNNGWRVEHAKKLISQGKAFNPTLREIGFLSGFSSQYHFFRAFKKAEGISIRTYLARNFK